MNSARLVEIIDVIQDELYIKLLTKDLKHEESGCIRVCNPGRRNGSAG